MEQIKNWQVTFKSDNRVYVRNNEWTKECTIITKNIADVIVLSSTDETFNVVPKYVKEFIKKKLF